ncbi:aminobenzoyl-glutamate utilization protein B [Brevibacillus reuszeri]|uniref:Amidohydrolase n=1 Tax=Brevibacillus reuszeri TaxID=54915 RepID=A0A0K9YLD4_9BACL|nr:M20 family metallopeptidase [Brevibacillus reuszeri]KNB69553.1 amidohydrolase [Brevibacillus reuszeri]MED1856080.1 M20 family metallopeptidase [Brevibacillus reuszeri]GED71256.1 aminobenzoyl-glutamate utilization protein B [Brevibacillus reuszeri]
MFNRQRIAEIIDQKSELFTNVSDRIWEYAETRFEEFRSAELLCKTLEAEGFTVEKGVAGIETAFIGSYGSGSPVIAILGEYDALSGLSQERGNATHQPIVAGGNGHGCGHNLLGSGSLAAAVAIRHYMEENGIKGTVRYYGCPAEEGGSGKAYMAREGLFNDADFAICWHPQTFNTLMSVSSLANYQVYFKFKGKAAHAAAAPHLGRSALDAVELMNIGVNYLREHIIPEARIHYAITNSGGFSPNVVQAEADVLYLIRAPKTQQVEEIYQRVCQIARGAAMMTETAVDIIFDKACSNLIPNQTMERVMYSNFTELGVPEFDQNEIDFARQIRTTIPDSDKNSELQMISKVLGARGKDLSEQLKNQELSSILMPLMPAARLMSGSTDVGDVSWIIPTVQCSTTCFAMGTQLHSWQAVAQGGTSIGHKGMLHAGKIMAATAIEMLLSPELIAEAKAELVEKLDGTTYVCPIPADIKPAARR